jgi:SAM-dependent methyltransferase
VSHNSIVIGAPAPETPRIREILSMEPQPLRPADFVEPMRRALASPPPGVDPWFQSYCHDLGDDAGLTSWLRAKRQLFALAGGVHGKDVLDAGSGFGVVSHLAAAWGARSVHALEIYGPMTDSHRLIRAAHFPGHHPVHILRGDVSAMPLRRDSVDLVLSIEAISHYFDITRFLDECARVLRPGGVLLISDGNNGANPAIRRFTEELWERFELGPCGALGTHHVDETMTERRERLLRERFPRLDEPRVRALALATSGWDAARIERAVARHLAGGPAPDSHYRRGTCPRDPVWGYWLERLFDPRGLACELANRGFQVRAVPHYGGARNDLVFLANRLLALLPGFRFARGFRIIARKR